MKGLLKFITCGSVDDGKSTLIGHILYDSKLLYADQEKALELDSKVGSREGKIDYSLLLDGLMAEREQGITIDVAYRYFTTDNRSFIVADTPGHEEYTRNMAVGASFADLAVILVDAKQGVLVQTRRHARICALMGIRYFVFAVNKMDLVGYDETRFREIEKQIEELKADAAEAAESKAKRDEFEQKVSDLEGKLADSELSRKLEKVGCRSVKAAKALLPDYVTSRSYALPSRSCSKRSSLLVPLGSSLRRLIPRTIRRSLTDCSESRSKEQ